MYQLYEILLKVALGSQLRAHTGELGRASGMSGDTPDVTGGLNQHD